ncbi:diacylglycerol/lipid kinase family protein [Facklamia hominis]|uniref:diacylglycerol/lipid kinase family protein n=1 Tax=Facklamia hominis TaxID=178214 RepID=UPI0038FC1C42
MKKILIIANPGSGKGDAPDYAKTLKEVLLTNYEVELEIRLTEKEGDANHWAKAAKQEGYDTVICLGGDGTVNEVVSGIAELDDQPFFSFVPLGTVNDLGRVVGFSMDPDEAIQQFAHLDETKVDIARVNNQYFINVLALGDIPTAVLETDSDQKNKLGFLAYLIDGVKAFFGGKNKNLRIYDSQGRHYDIASNLILVALTSSVGGMEGLIQGATYNDGMAHLYAIKDSMALSSIQTLVQEKGLPDETVNNDHLLALRDSAFRIESVEGHSTNELKSNVDGDEGPALPLEIEILKGCIPMLIPRKA